MPTPEQYGSGTPLIPSRAINFSINIEGPADPVDEGGAAVIEEETRKMPYDGIVSQVYIDIPNGVHSRAGFQIRDDERGSKQFPFDEESEFAAFNDVQDFWPVTFPMQEGEEIMVKYINEDHNTSGHFLKVWAIVVGIDALPLTLEEMAEREGVRL